MIDKSVFDIFSQIEKGYKSNNELPWGNYFSQIDWDIVDGKVRTFVKILIGIALNVVLKDV